MSTATPASTASSRTAYTQGHSAKVVESHLSRTVDNSAAFLLPHLRPDFKIVDLGCGPGSITRGFSALVPDGVVTGIDASAAVIEQARSLSPPAEYANLRFEAGDVTARLPFEDDSVDVVYTHQLLLHLPTPVPVLTEAYRILKPGGMLAVREADHVAIEPSDHGTEKYWACMDAAIKATGAQGFKSGRRLHNWAAAAGFDRAKMHVGAGALCYTGPTDARWWADVHVGRLETDVGRQWLESGVVTSRDEIVHMLAALRAWGDCEDAWFAVFQGELIARK